jgi:hypothetical protein
VTAKKKDDVAKKKDGGAAKRPTVAEQARRNEDIVAARMRGISYRHLARTYGMSKSRVHQIHQEFREEDGTLRNQDPVEVVDEMLEGFQSDIEELVLLGATTQQDSVRVSSITARMAARQKIIDLLQELGVLPKDLGQLSVQLDARMTAMKVLGVLKQHNVPIEVLRDLHDALNEGHGPIVDAEVLGELEPGEE